MNARSFLVRSGITYAGAIASVVCTIAFYLISLRIDTRAFGELQSALSIMFLLYAGRTVAGGYVVIHAAENEKLLGAVSRIAAKLTALMGFGFAAILIVLAPYLRDFLHLDSQGSFLLMGCAAVPAIVAGMFDGILNVQKKFVALSISTTLYPLFNAILAVALFRDGFHSSDAGWIVLGSQCISCLNIAFVDWQSLRIRDRFTPSRSAIRESIELLASSLLFGAAIRMDVLWAKHILTPEQAGSYAIAASIAIVIYLITNSVGRVSSVSLRTGSGIGVVFASYGLIIGVSAILAGGFMLFGESVLFLLVGRDVPIDWSILWPLFVGMAFYSIITLDYTCLNVVTKRVHVGIGLLLVIASGAAMFLWGKDAFSIAIVRCYSMVLLTCIFSISLIRSVRRIRSFPSAHPAETHLVQH